jgi:uncharacterized protein DUF4129
VGSRREAIGAGGAAVAVVALLAVVAAGAGASLHADPDADRTAASIAVFPMLVLLGAAGAAAVLTTVFARRRMLRDAEDGDEPNAGGRRSRLLRIALFLLPFAVAAALIFALAVRPAGEAPRHRTTTPAPPAGAPPARVPDGRDAWGVVALAGGAVGGTLLIAFVLLRGRPRRPARRAPVRPPDGAPPAAAVDDALAALGAETDPRRAIIAAYVRMERALDAAGLGRREPEAPREYLARVAGALRGDARAAGRLTALYEEARFSAHPLDEGMRAEALAALRALRAEAAA